MDRKISYPERNNLSRFPFPIQMVCGASPRRSLWGAPHLNSVQSDVSPLIHPIANSSPHASPATHPERRLPTPHSSPLYTRANQESRLSTGPPFRLRPTRSSVRSWMHEPGTCCRHRCIPDAKEPSVFARHRAHHARHCSFSPTPSRQVNSMGNMERSCPRPNPCSECIPAAPSTVRRT